MSSLSSGHDKIFLKSCGSKDTLLNAKSGTTITGVNMAIQTGTTISPPYINLCCGSESIFSDPDLTKKLIWILARLYVNKI